MLPIGSVGIVISKSRKNSDPGKRSNRRPLPVDDLEMTVEPLALGVRSATWAEIRGGQSSPEITDGPASAVA